MVEKASGHKGPRLLIYKRCIQERKSKDRPNAPVIGIDVGLIVIAVQVEITILVPIHVEPVTGGKLILNQHVARRLLYFAAKGINIPAKVGNPFSLFESSLPQALTGGIRASLLGFHLTIVFPGRSLLAERFEQFSIRHILLNRQSLVVHTASKECGQEKDHVGELYQRRGLIGLPVGINDLLQDVDHQSYHSLTNGISVEARKLFELSVKHVKHARGIMINLQRLCQCHSLNVVGLGVP